MKDENVYRKNKAGRYEPIGLETDYLPDGIWYVRHHEGYHSVSNVSYLEGLYKLASPDDFKDIKQICSLQEYTDFILDSQEMRDLMNSKIGYTMNEFVAMCVSLVFRKNNRKP